MPKGTESQWWGDFFPERTWFHCLHSVCFLFRGKCSWKERKLHKEIFNCNLCSDFWIFFFLSECVVLSSNHSTFTSSQLPTLASFTFWKDLHFIPFSPFVLLICLSCSRCSFVPSFISVIGVWGVVPGIGVTRCLPLGTDQSAGWGWRQVTKPFPPSILLSSKPVLYVTALLEV